ncbi:sugar nucleotide-binding protein [Microbulbifer thermotolerans]|uniref:dTDP-4-dehydrorhamnose reductase n=1 Tax=Microbulbifer thermotolerans TaxID=252514 RepID=A0A143HJD8_MICTH|nr:sugar nucleotide-binding protein [Microbulbifer thermotolerans]AMX01621.1 dTDP-4-dehydrorhamnose reductase [Microbulbifer thermotolerans]MCX2780225.1 NAD(P)-dependent oxidoreductase [Microbulbifer thermotolerans]MCX2783849.1 NAD(P)-dependent oxidoreductase [Microbulbifer thermotolerans]MCX2795950.1 NAD(P)-dependent oxidoreductase [Microbulbifer thermotolerans]MCX2802631.1 NAD(P)-dependent oxidoreductase [Microbulbifer thermotolerans]
MQEHHTGYQPDSVAVIGVGSALDAALQKRLQRAGFRVQLLAAAELGELRPGSIVINASACGGRRGMSTALDVCEQLAQINSGNLIHLSSCQVFRGGERKVYDEEALPQPDCEAGCEWLACEAALGGCENLITLRFGWMVDLDEDALLGRILRSLVAGRPVSLDDQSRGSPVTVSDMARVTVAVAQQLASGAPSSGIYHYGSADSCTAMEFAREVVERAQSFCDEDLSAALSPLEEGEARSVVLACGKLRDVFGIQQRSWRQGLTRQVELWLERLGKMRRDEFAL